MNELIEKFAEQCTTSCIDGRGVELNEIDVEKFAELIVRECVKEIGYKSVDLLDIDFYLHYQERLKKHFGVEP